MERAFGANKAKKDIREYSACLTQAGIDISFPEEFELTMPDVKNQLNVSSCVAHAIATAVEYFNQQQENDNKKFSTAFIYGNRRNMNNLPGMFVDVALNNVVKYGDVYKEDLDGNYEVPKAIDIFEEQALELAPKAYPHRFTSFYRLNTIDEIKAQLMTKGPVVFSIPWYSDYYVENKTYIMKHFNNYIEGYHAMVIYGWNKYGWKFQNSWGKTFGNQGRAILEYDTKFNTCYGITDDILLDTKEKQIKELRELLSNKEKELQNQTDNNDELKKEIEELLDKISQNEKDINNLKSELLDIEKPFKKMPKWLAEIINLIINVFKS